MCLLGVRQRFGSGVIREGGTCARENIYRPSLRSAKADISSTLDTVTTINKLDTINTPETFTSTLNKLTTSHYNYYTALIMVAGCSSQNTQTPVMLSQNLTQTYFKQSDAISVRLGGWLFITCEGGPAILTKSTPNIIHPSILDFITPINIIYCENTPTQLLWILQLF